MVRKPIVSLPGHASAMSCNYCSGFGYSNPWLMRFIRESLRRLHFCLQNAIGTQIMPENCLHPTTVKEQDCEYYNVCVYNSNS